MRVAKAHKCYLVVRALQWEEADGIRGMKILFDPSSPCFGADLIVQSNHSRLLSLVNHALKELKIYSSGNGIEDSKAIVAW